LAGVSCLFGYTVYLCQTVLKTTIMNLKIQQYWQSYTGGLYANRLASLTLAIALIILTPLCGWLFACGCTWPGLGLDAKCNFHQAHALHHCPWCASKLAGWGSVGLATAVGVMVSVFPIVKTQNNFIYKVLLGVLAFVGTVILTGLLAAAIQDYPL
jgi:hypothetical protein